MNLKFNLNFGIMDYKKIEVTPVGTFQIETDEYDLIAKINGKEIDSDLSFSDNFDNFIDSYYLAVDIDQVNTQELTEYFYNEFKNYYSDYEPYKTVSRFFNNSDTDLTDIKAFIREELEAYLKLDSESSNISAYRFREFLERTSDDYKFFEYLEFDLSNNYDELVRIYS